MSQENVQVVSRAIAAVNARDIGSYLACCTDDIDGKISRIRIFVDRREALEAAGMAD